jgi:hypothetical protein
MWPPAQVRPNQQGDPHGRHRLDRARRHRWRLRCTSHWTQVGFLAKALFHVQTLNTFFNLSTWITAIVGAAILFLLMRAVSGNRRGRRA